MDEYLFFQQHKKQLHDSKSILSPQIFTTKVEQQQMNLNFAPTPEMGKGKAQFVQSPRINKTSKFPPQQKVNLRNVQPAPPGVNSSIAELTQETMQQSLRELSTNYTDQYAASGFPPKICTLILKEISSINKLRCKVLDVGCGKGHVGEYLKQDGFLHITGIDCSKNLLAIAKDTKAYERLDRVAIGETQSDEFHNEQYDFVISSSMVNNDGWDEEVFTQMLRYVKMGGFVIFATKLNLQNEDHYNAEIKKLSEEQHWKFVTDHTFYRYDKLCNGKGKFSNKMVKIVAYQKTDHTNWLDQEKDRLDEEEMIRAKQQAIIDAKIAAKEAKLNGAANRANQRKMLKQKNSSQAVAEEENEAELARQEEQREAEELELAEQKKQFMMEKINKFMHNAMWIQLKNLQQVEVKRLNERRQEMAQKMQEEKRNKEIFNPAG